jgi:hypothetical protein
LWPCNHPIHAHVCLNSCSVRNHYTASDRTGIYDVHTTGSADKILFTRKSFSLCPWSGVCSSLKLSLRIGCIYFQPCLFNCHLLRIAVTCGSTPSHLNGGQWRPSQGDKKTQIITSNTRGHTKHGAYLLHLPYRYTSVVWWNEMYCRYDNLAR